MSTASVAKYWKLFDIGLQNTFVSRWNFLLRTVFGIIPLAGMIFIWRAVFDASGKPIAGYDYSSMIYYFMVTVFLDNIITPTEDEWQIAAEIREGRISSYLIKPMNYLLYRITAYVSYRLLYIAVVFLPICGLAIFFREHIAFPAHAITWPVLALSTLMAAFIQFFIATVSVNTNRGSAKKNTGLGFCLRQCFGQLTGAFDAAFVDSALFRGRPPPGNALTGQMNHRVEAFQSARFQHRPIRPDDGVVARRARQRDHTITTRR